MKLLATMGKVIVVLFALNFVAVVVVVVLMAGKGYVTREKLAAAVEILRAEAEPLTPVDGGQAASQPAVGGVTATDVPAPMTLSDRERAHAVVRAEMDAEIEQAQQLRAMVERERRQLERDRADFEAERKAFQESVDEVAQARRAEGLKEVVKTYKALKAPRIKELISPLSDEEVGLILIGLDTRLRGKVIDEFRTPDELKRMQGVMKLIREGAVTKAGTQSGGTS